MVNRTTAAALAITAMGMTVSAQSLAVTARTNPQRIVGGGTSVVAIEATDGGKPLPDQAVTLSVVEGPECGNPDRASVTTGPDGTATVARFQGAQFVENCLARLRVVVERPGADGAPVRTAEAMTTVLVNPDTATARIDGFSALALVIVVAFAIDRLVRGLLFALSYWPLWARMFPDPALDGAPDSAPAERNRKLIYFALAGSLAVIALAWVGGVRILTALGFTNVNPWLDVLITGLILAGGADRTEHILRSVGASGPTAEAKQSAPIEITGRLMVTEESRKGAGRDRDAVTRSFVLGGSDVEGV
jgi:hypothetical protein